MSGVWKIIGIPGPGSKFSIRGGESRIHEHLAALSFIPASLDSPLETYRVNFLGTLNLLEAVRQSVRQKGRPGGVYNVCSGSSHSVRQLLDWLLEASGARSVAGHDVVIEADPARIRPDEIAEVVGANKAAREELAWSPVIPLRQTVTDCLDWWRAQLGAVGSPRSSPQRRRGRREGAEVL